jgi:FlaA1/EpsC-like NDP-sugar epimerase
LPRIADPRAVLVRSANERARHPSGRARRLPSIRIGRGRAAVLVALHAAAFLAIYLFAYAIRFEGAVPREYRDAAIGTMIPVVGAKLAVFLILGCHRGWWRSATFADLTGLAEAAALGSALGAIVLIVGRAAPISWSVLLIDWTGTTMGLCGARIGYRLLRERYGPLLSSRRLRRVLVVGTGSAGEAVVRAIGAQPQLGLKVVGVLDGDRQNHGRALAGAAVLGNPDDLATIAARSRAELVLIPTPATPGREVRTLVDTCNAAGIKAQIVPGFDALFNGGLVVRPRDVDIRDLLGREPVRLDCQGIGHLLEGRVALVTGAAGSIGSEICRQVLRFRPQRLVLLDHSENGLFFLERELAAAAGATEIVTCLASITDAARLRDLFTTHRPKVVFHAAAHKHVPLVESNPGEAVKNNILGTRTVVDEVVRSGAEAFVLISTDKAVNPTSVMGACKRLAEGYVKAVAGRTATRLITVRFGNVLGSNGSVVPIFQEQIRNGGPVTVTHPSMTRYFMTIPEAAQLVLQAARLGRGGEIFVLDMGEPVRVLDLARDMIRLSGLAEGRGIEIVHTGLRPGEKLYEELHDATEDLMPTAHPKIRVLPHRPSSLERVEAGLERLAAVMNGPNDQVVAVLRELVPDYHSVRAGTSPGAQEHDAVLRDHERDKAMALDDGRSPRRTGIRGNALEAHPAVATSQPTAAPGLLLAGS